MPTAGVEGLNVIEVCLLANLDTCFVMRPDLVLLSTQMPDGNSFDICRKLNDSFFKSIIMLIPKDAKDSIAPGLEAGANHYVINPCA